MVIDDGVDQAPGRTLGKHCAEPSARDNSGSHANG